jgi:hypothetical protein
VSSVSLSKKSSGLVYPDSESVSVGSIRSRAEDQSSPYSTSWVPLLGNDALLTNLAQRLPGRFIIALHMGTSSESSTFSPDSVQP